MEDSLFADAFDNLLVSRCTAAEVRAIERGGETATVWDAIEGSGFCDALVPEQRSGAGLGLRDAYLLLEACGRHALPLPFPQTMLARALLAHAGIEAPGGPIALATMPAPDVPMDVVQGAVSRWLLVSDGRRMRLVDLREARREPSAEGCLDARVALPAGSIASFESAIDLRAQQALLLAAQMAGLMRSVLSMTLKYAEERSQFGRTIGKFQAIQHQLSVMAGHAEAARIAAMLACATDDATARPLACALAKAGTATSVVPVAAIAHAVHGAIGVAHEYDLHLYTRRLHAWRVAEGAESYWNERVGRALLARADLTVPEFVRAQLAHD